MEAAGSYYVGGLAAANSSASGPSSSKHTNSHRVGLELASRPHSGQAQVCMSLTRAGLMHAAARRADTNESTAFCVDGGATPDRGAGRLKAPCHWFVDPHRAPQ